ncbi:MAG: hypothetical protein A2Y97_04145 [Nitrospirae bacterium RBG_13_39_12]|nr:MAG: hypothetical protein A2Y97_04145 [Nitrospirae bacterium RBG_13_39_12]
MGSIKETSLNLNEFTISEQTKEITACPAGQAPERIKQKTNGVITAVFSKYVLMETIINV